jgi:hypothetical protein
VNARRTDETSTRAAETGARAEETGAHAEETGARAEETGVHAAETRAHADEAARRSRAAGIVATVAERLSDPETVAAVMARDPRTNHAASLANGFPSVALLFAELGTTDPGHRHTAHTMLERAVKEPGDGDVSLHSGLASLAFAARANARDTGDYGTLLGQLDDHLSEAARLLSAPSNVRGWRHDVITGLAGLGRYLLMSPATPPDAMRAILRHLVALTDPVEVEGTEVPGWWVMALPWTSMSEDTAKRYRHGHGNLGISHGIPGPLALLALSWKAGLTVPGQREAMEGIVEWLLGWSSSDEHGIRWPTTVTMDQHRDRAAGTPATRAMRALWRAGAMACPVSAARSSSPGSPSTGPTGPGSRTRPWPRSWAAPPGNCNCARPRCATDGRACCRWRCASTPTALTAGVPPPGSRSWRPNARCASSTPARPSATGSRSPVSFRKGPAFWRGPPASRWPCTVMPPARRPVPAGTPPC